MKLIGILTVILGILLLTQCNKKFDSKQRESKDKTKNKKPNKSKFRKTTKRG